MKMQSAIPVEENIYETDLIQSPFVLGILKPKIYIPVNIPNQERDYIILHEQTHISRYDHLIKIVAYLILCIHWFNPFAWAAFILMGVDMEMSCDERVLKEVGEKTKKDYSLSLLSMATKRHLIGGSPLAFSEGGLKARIKNVLNFKKTTWIIVISAVVLTTALSIGLALNRTDRTVDNDTENLQKTINELSQRLTEEEDRRLLLISAEVERLAKEHNREEHRLQLAEDIRQSILRVSDTINDCSVVIYLGEDATDTTLKREPGAQITLSLNEHRPIEHLYVRAIASMVRGSLPGIKNENIIITDDDSHPLIYPVSEDTDVLSWIITEYGDEFVTLNSMEAASRYNPFPIAIPSVLPANVVFDHANVNMHGGSYYAHGPRLIFHFNLEDDENVWDNTDTYQGWRAPHISLNQLNMGSSGLHFFREEYNNVPWSSPPDEMGRILESTPFIIADTDAILSAYFMPVLLGQEAPPDDYVIDAWISWYKDGISYTLYVFAPGGTITLDDMVAMAESVG